MSHSASTKKPGKSPKTKAAPGPDPLIRDLTGYLLTERKRSPLTVAAYERDLMEFAAFVPSLRDVTPSQIRQYIAHMFDAHNYNSRTVCRKLSSIRALYRFLKI
ncbi:MAG TPA: site-specific integrase, partial [Candidatus Binatia bacterium]|nr:site-specific integrase [Candidatus Binatia bacterium]